ncbi:rhodanese-like domain-containing protein [Microbacterium terrisoli]|uniref:rhodanese-like domain-containing protein n=1 Tax=Microbacterium terrisoli TaxID=3242192 RepID=UPI00280557C1|nr:rhodanese-like domain-containing protein [Microbacterium protaetiae]
MKSITVHDLHDQHDVPLVDVREPDEYAAGHVPGAINLPMSTIRDRMEDLPEGPFNVICQVGGRSARVTKSLEQQGYDVTNVEGGTGEWIARGFDVER